MASLEKAKELNHWTEGINEFRLILSLLRTPRRSPVCSLSIPAFDFQHLDWAIFLQLTRRHGIAPLLHSLTSDHSAHHFPQLVRVSLLAAYETTLQNNTKLADELLAIIQTTQGLQLTAIPYKGPSLAIDLYGDLALREFGDLDILVRQDELVVFKQILETRGYTPRFHIEDSELKLFTTSSRQYDLEMINSTSNILVELHWKTDSRYVVEELSSDSWRNHLHTIDVNDQSLPKIPDRDLFLILAIHVSKHRWEKLSWLIDLKYLFVRLGDDDLNWIFIKAKSLRCTRRLLVTFELLQHLFGDFLHPNVTCQLSSQWFVKSLAKILARPLVRPQYRQPPLLFRITLELLLVETISGRFILLRDLIIFPNAHDWHSDNVRDSSPVTRIFFRIGILVKRHVTRLLHLD